MSSTAAPPLFSVVIPTYNRAAKVVRAVESVLAQTCSDYDVWVIDDGSTDTTPHSLAPYLDRIHYIQQANGGVAQARNRGMQASRGSYIALLDSDDRWHPQKLAATARAIAAQPRAGLFYSQWEVVDQTGARLWVDRSRDASSSPKGGDASSSPPAYLTLLKGDFLATSSAVIQRACLEAVGGFDAHMSPCEDWDLWLRISRQYPIQYIPEILVAFEHTRRDKLTSNIQPWLAAHDRVIAKAFAAHPTLSAQVRRAVLANLEYIKGRVCLQAASEGQALLYFRQAVVIQPTLLKAQGYVLVLSSPRIRRLLPLALRRRMRLPAELGEVA